jgi:hypothetical protein
VQCGRGGVGEAPVDDDHLRHIRECRGRCRYSKRLTRYQYALCDIILLFQVYYYRWKNPATHNALGASYGGSGATGETAPLLPNGPPVVLVQPAPSTIKQVVKYVGLLVVVLAAGAGAWFVNEYFVPHTQPVPKDRETIIELKSQILGWISAASYCESPGRDGWRIR